MFHNIMFCCTERVLNVRESNYWACLVHCQINGISSNCACLLLWPIASWMWHNGWFIFGHPSEMSDRVGTRYSRVKGRSVWPGPFVSECIAAFHTYLLYFRVREYTPIITLLEVVLLCAFAKLRKASVSFVVSLWPSVCLSVRTSVRPSAWHNSVAIGQIFMKFDIWGYSKNMSRKSKFY
jgi:hypothetical protein